MNKSQDYLPKENENLEEPWQSMFELDRDYNKSKETSFAAFKTSFLQEQTLPKVPYPTKPAVQTQDPKRIPTRTPKPNRPEPKTPKPYNSKPVDIFARNLADLLKKNVFITAILGFFIFFLISLPTFQLIAPNNLKPSKLLGITRSPEVQENLPEIVQEKPSDYPECVDQGGEILETYPEQCQLKGETFTRVLSEEEKQTNQVRHEKLPVIYKESKLAPSENCNEQKGYEDCKWYLIEEPERIKLPESLSENENLLFTGTLEEKMLKILEIEEIVKSSEATPETPETVLENVEADKEAGENEKTEASPEDQETAESENQAELSEFEIKEKDAIDRVKNRPEVQSWLTKFNNPETAETNEPVFQAAEVDNYSNTWSVHVYEDTPERTVTFNYYIVYFNSGEVVRVF